MRSCTEFRITPEPTGKRETQTYLKSETPA
jgi:hypothetical protein